MFFKLVKDLTNSFPVWLAWIFSVNQDIIQLHNDKNIRLFSENLINVSLKTDEGVRQVKKYDLVLKMTVSCLKCDFLFVTFANRYPVISTS